MCSPVLCLAPLTLSVFVEFTRIERKRKLPSSHIIPGLFHELPLRLPQSHSLLARGPPQARPSSLKSLGRLTTHTELMGTVLTGITSPHFAP